MSKDENKLGATGKFPLGKLNPEDEGELRMAVAADLINNRIVIEFGKPTQWLGLDIAGARQMIDLIHDKIVRLESQGPLKFVKDDN